MTGLRFWRNLMAVPMFLGLVVIAGGCGGGDKKDSGSGVTKPKEGSGSSSTGSSSGSKTATKGDKTALTAAMTGSIKGKVTVDGAVPEPKDLDAAMKAKAEFSHCLKDNPKNKKDPTWMVSPNKEVKNVVVWLRAPQGKYFSVPDDQKKRSDTVSIDQPFCMFTPHVVTLYPDYFDGKQLEKTGQKFEVKNTAPVPHNTSWTATNTVANTGDNKIIAANTGKMEIVVRPDRPKNAGGEELVSIKCDIHPWMGAKAWAFDHPYSVVTGDDGTFEIKNAPEGVELELCYWHESFGAKPKTEKVTLSAGKPVEKNLTIKP